MSTEREIVGTVDKHYLAKSKEKQTPSVKFVIKSDVDDEKFFFDLWLTDAAFQNTMKVLKEVIGWTGTNFDDLNGTGKFAGVKVSMVIEDGEYQGKPQSKVKFINKIGGQASAAFSADEIMNLNKKINEELPKAGF